MEIKASIVIMSHLSDIQANPTDSFNNVRINFVKYLILKYPNTFDKIIAEYEFRIFEEKYPHLSK